jgi:hypothetical protein
MPKKQSPKPSAPEALHDELADFDADMERDKALDRPGRTSPFVSDDRHDHRSRRMIEAWLARRKGVRQ